MSPPAVDSGQPPAAAPAGQVRREVRRWRNSRVEIDQDCIAEEVPVAFVYNELPHAVMMATPHDLEDFAVGFSLSEGLIERAAELESIVVRPLLEGIELELRLPVLRARALEARQRNLAGRSGCGLCGVRALEDALRQPAAVGAGTVITVQALQHALAHVHAMQPLNGATGATHAAAWVRADGVIALLREDVGRHNALDKLIGALARVGEDLQRGFVLVTSRASYEMVQKAATAGIGMLVAISAPTALGIQLAETTGLTLVGFARSAGHVVYAHPQRIGPIAGPPR